MTTVFRAPQLIDGAGTGRYRTTLDARLSGARRISRADLAAAMLASIDDPALIGRTVTIAG
jgi:putative NADH-flavin reductase